MMDSLLEKVEERITTLVSELHALRQQNQSLLNENAQLKSAEQHQYVRLQGLALLMDGLQLPEQYHQSLSVED